MSVSSVLGTQGSPNHLQRAFGAATRPTVRVGRLETRWIDPDEATLFVQRYEAASAMTMDLRYALMDGVRGFFVDGELVAGYRMGREPLRYAGLAGARHVSGWPFGLDEAAEISHLWIGPEMPLVRRRVVYGWMLTDLLSTRKPYIVGGSVNPLTRRQQMRSLPFSLGEIVAKDLHGNGTPVWLYYGTVSTMVADAIATGVPLPWLGAMR